MRVVCVRDAHARLRQRAYALQPAHASPAHMHYARTPPPIFADKYEVRRLYVRAGGWGPLTVFA
jgi:hypothetical protein